MSTSEDTKMKPHVHKDIIIAWANGAQIQYRDSKGEWWDIDNPSWHPNEYFRVKPDVETELIDLLNDTFDLDVACIAYKMMHKFNITLKD